MILHVIIKDAGRDMDCIDCRFRNILAYYNKADVTPEERKWFMARLTEICSCNVYRAHINGTAFLLKDTLVTVEAVRQQLNDSRFTVVYAGNCRCLLDPCQLSHFVSIFINLILYIFLSNFRAKNQPKT